MLQVLVQALSFGTIGLGLGLAYFAYRLLALEQKRDNARTSVLNSIKHFAVYSFALVLVGAVLEFSRLVVGPDKKVPMPCPVCESISGKSLDDLFMTGVQLGLAQSQAAQPGGAGPIGNVGGANLRATASGLLSPNVLSRLSNLSGNQRPTEPQLKELETIITAELQAHVPAPSASAPR